jgi:hypothetical protein
MQSQLAEQASSAAGEKQEQSPGVRARLREERTLGSLADDHHP